MTPRERFVAAVRKIGEACPCADAKQNYCPCRWGGGADGSRQSCACSVDRVKEEFRRGPKHQILACVWLGHAGAREAVQAVADMTAPGATVMEYVHGVRVTEDSAAQHRAALLRECGMEPEAK